jgi:hypothetical protein
MNDEKFLIGDLAAPSLGHMHISYPLFDAYIELPIYVEMVCFLI